MKAITDVCAMTGSSDQSYSAWVEFRVLWWNVDAWSGRTVDQIAALRGLQVAPHVLALGELQRHSFAAWQAALERDGYTVVDSDRPGEARRTRVLLAAKQDLRPVARRRFDGMRPGSVASAEIQAGVRRIDVHAVHIPNGTANGWMKIDHLRAVRSGLEPAPDLPAQVLCGDFNTPQLERPGEIITFGQTPDGSWRARPTSSKPFSADRPFDPIEWDAGERAVLEGLDKDCGMPDTFMRAHPGTVESTWVPKGSPEERGRRLDHIFAAAELEVISCRHIHEWRRDEPRLSDHSAIEAVFGL